jgi:hypothetical protein
MNIEDAFRFVATTKPSLLYITGKTCTGKTTFAHGLAERYGYRAVVLDEIVQQAVVIPLDLQTQEPDVFVSVYRNTDRPEWIDRFVAEVRQQIAVYLEQQQPVLIEGALANTDTIQRIFAGYPSAQVLYFHPKVSGSRYIQNLTERLTGSSATDPNGLPKGFWEHITSADFTQFYKDGVITDSLQKSIAAYAAESVDASNKRLATFRQHLANIQVVEI